MKKILNVSGVQKLSKQTQQTIKGSGQPIVYCKGPKRCCYIQGNGVEFCDYGYCMSNGSCVWA